MTDLLANLAVIGVAIGEKGRDVDVQLDKLLGLLTPQAKALYDLIEREIEETL